MRVHSFYKLKPFKIWTWPICESGLSWKARSLRHLFSRISKGFFHLTNVENLCHWVNGSISYYPPHTSYIPISLSKSFPLFIEHFQKQTRSAKMKQQQHETIASVEMKLCCWIFKFCSIFPQITSTLVVLLPQSGKLDGESAPAPPLILVLCTRAYITLAGHTCASLNPQT